MIRSTMLLFALLTSGFVLAEGPSELGLSLDRTLRLKPSPSNPRNSEGDFVRLIDGRILLVYTHYDGGAGDHASAYLAGRFSSDGGRSWTDADVTVLANEGAMNVMSVSLLRLADRRIALFYLRKNSQQDCRPYARFSTDEAKSWSDPVPCISDAQTGYYVLNNDRVIQLRSGRLVAPVAQHYGAGWNEWKRSAQLLCYLSDDAGRTWRRGAGQIGSDDTEPPGVMLQEPGIVELTDGRLMLFCRTDAGCQYLSYSNDGGEHWSAPIPSNIRSPLSPASIERIPDSGELLLVWNDQTNIEEHLAGKRTPLAVAVSRDEGQSWHNLGPIETNPHGWYCYTSLEFVDGHALLAYCAGDRRQNNGLAVLQVSRIPLNQLGSSR